MTRRHEIPRVADVSFRLTIYLSYADNRMQQIFEPDASKHLRADTIGDAVDDFGSILGRVNMDAKGPLAEGRIDHIQDGRGDGARIGICGLQARKSSKRRLGYDRSLHACRHIQCDLRRPNGVR
jgi:hypothetical protein